MGLLFNREVNGDLKTTLSFTSTVVVAVVGVVEGEAAAVKDSAGSGAGGRSTGGSCSEGNSWNGLPGLSKPSAAVINGAGDFGGSGWRIFSLCVSVSSSF